MATLEAYLDEVVSHLDGDPLRRDEIRLQVHAHLRELIDERVREGAAPEEAEREVLSGLGRAEDVAAEWSRWLPGSGARVLRRIGAAAIAFLISWGVCVQAELLVRNVVVAIAPALGLHYYPTMPALFALIIVAELLLGALPAYVLWSLSRRASDVWLICAGWGILWLVEALEGSPYRGERLVELLAQLAATLIGTLVTAALLARRDRARSVASGGAGAVGDAIDRYVSDVAAELPVDPLRRDEVRLEVHAHLRELCADASRATAGDPQAEALARFGTVEDVAGALAEANSRCRPTPLDPARLSVRIGAVAVACLAYLASYWGLLRLLLGVVYLVTGNSHPLPSSSEAAVVWGLTNTLCAALAAVLVAAISSKPWDVLIVGALIAPLLFAVRAGTPWAQQSITDVAALFLGAISAALLLSHSHETTARRRKVTGHANDEVGRSADGPS